MMLTAKQENAKTLASALGIHEDEAGELLRCHVTVNYDPQCEFATLVASHASALLNRMMDGDIENSCTSAIELVIGNAKSLDKARCRVYVQILPDAITVSAKQMPPSVTSPGLHPVFAILSACYAAAAVTRWVAFGDQGGRVSSPIIVRPSELLGEDLRHISEPVNLGEAVLAGAGAVANGFLFGFRTFDVSGTLHIVDPKKVASGILNRCLWFETDDLGWPKSEQLSVRAQSHFPGLRLIPHVMTVSEFVRDRLEQHRIKRLIVSVDSRRARRSLQAEFPHEVYDASTTGIEEVVLHFNRRPTELACMSCIYCEAEQEISHEAHVADALGVTVEEVKSGFISEDIACRISRRYPDVPLSDIAGRAFDTLFKQLCGVGALKGVEDRQVLAPFSFVPVLAGAYLAIEIVRRLAIGTADMPFNYWRAGPWASPNIELRQLRRALPNCEFCSNPVFQAAEKRIWLGA
jgi:hypothetical protein